MYRITCPALALLLLPCSVVAQNRAVIVKSADKELLHTAHRLGVAPERVTRARQFLREASELAVDLAETEDILRLGHFGELLSKGRTEEADLLFAETLELATATPSLETLNALRNLLFLHSRMGDPERTEELIATWASLANLTQTRFRTWRMR